MIQIIVDYRLSREVKQTEGPANSDTLSQGHAEQTCSVAAIVVQKLEHIDSSLEKNHNMYY